MHITLLHFETLALGDLFSVYFQCLAKKFPGPSLSKTSHPCCDWLNREGVAKQVARTMLHIVLLCNLKTIQFYVLLKKSENSAARGGVKQENHTCNLQKLFSETSFRGVLLSVYNRFVCEGF